MAFITRRAARATSAWPALHKKGALSAPGIQAKILVPLIVLMVLSLFGSTIGFLLSTETTRNRILDSQMADDTQRLIEAWSRREQDLAESASILAHDSVVNTALQHDLSTP